jgi:hypothetical protein
MFAVQRNSSAQRKCVSLSAAANFEAIRQLFPHMPSYSPNFASSGYLIFGPLKDAFRIKISASGDKVKETVCTWLRTRLQIFFADGMRRHVNHNTICFEEMGDYVEK